MHNRRSRAALVLIAITTTWAGHHRAVFAGDGRPSPEERNPRAIMEAVYNAGGEGSPRSGRLRLTNKPSSGAARERVMQVRYLGDATTRRSLLLVEAPSDVRGTGFVAIEYPHSDKNAERWLYLANLKRSTRIAGGQMSGSFMGSDLSFADLSQPDPGRFDFTLITASELVGNEDCWVISAKAKDPKTQDESGYVEVQFWISKQKLTMVRMRAPLTAGRGTKYMEGSDFMQVERYWTPRRLVIRTVESGKVRSESVLETLELKGDPSVSATDFTKQRLELGP
jgi:hypothetical protein